MRRGRPSASERVSTVFVEDRNKGSLKYVEISVNITTIKKYVFFFDPPCKQCMAW